MNHGVKGTKKKAVRRQPFYIIHRSGGYSPLPSIFSFNAAKAPISPNVDFST